MANEIISTEQREQAPSSKDAAVEQIVDSAVELGRLWARHGLTLGKMALETSATSLGTTAKLLAGLADALTPPKDEPQKA